MPSGAPHLWCSRVGILFLEVGYPAVRCCLQWRSRVDTLFLVVNLALASFLGAAVASFAGGLVI